MTIDYSFTKQQKPQRTGCPPKRFKLLIIFIIIILLILIFSALAELRDKQQQDIAQTKYPVSELENKIPDFVIEFDKAVKDENKEKITTLLKHLKDISPYASPELKIKINDFAQEQINNPQLSDNQKRSLNDIINVL